MARRGEVAAITLKDRAALDGMRRAGALVAETLALLRERCLPGVTTAELDRLADEHITARGGVPSFLGYPGPTPYPASICASLNEVVLHGIPGPRALRDGDIISLDVGVKLNGFYGDSAVTVPVGRVPERTTTLLRVTREALDRAIAQVNVGGRLSDIGHAVQQWVEAHGFSVVREFVGHGIGERLHEEPSIPNYGQAGRGPKLAEGMVLAIEPMVAMGQPETRVLSDGWTAVTRDGSLAAHFEHTVAVSAAGPLVLTARKSAPAGAAAG